MAGGRECRTSRLKDVLLWRKSLGISTLFCRAGKKTRADPNPRCIFSSLADRYYLPELPEPGQEVLLPQDLGRHLRTVLRLRRGDRLQLFDGKGEEAQAEIQEAGRGGVRVRVLAKSKGGEAPWRELELAFAVPKGSRLETLLAQATQLGVRRLQPLLFERSPKSARLRSIPPRWERILQAAAGQCRLDRLPLVLPPLPLRDWLQAPLPPQAYIALPPARGTPILGPEPSRSGAALLVGPEGGFSPEEVEEAREGGLVPLCLAPTVLRIETAATVGLALLLAAGRREE
ncbi:MAG TPA: 16S rRNA (uracil(1498)-N(3))-methyltransferase [Planctomycetes bacterium]|nr:16S rRNA (uracil(1498)-N(3))-methyltransferase [Planctomycetota bacterium]